MKVSTSALASAILVAGVAIGLPVAVYAATDAGSELTQEITSGTLSTSIRDASDAAVASPSFAMDPVTVSTSQQSTNGVFGTSTQRIAVDNPSAADNGWTLALNATTPGSDWTDGSNTYNYNDSAANGRLTVDPSTGTLTPLQGTATGIALGSSSNFTGTTPITIVTASAGSDNIWNGYVTGIDLTQTIPASQPSGNYSIDMTQTVAAQ